MITDEEIYELAKYKYKYQRLNFEKENLLSEFKNCNDLQELLKKYNDLKCTAPISNDDILLESIEEVRCKINEKWNSLFDYIKQCSGPLELLERHTDYLYNIFEGKSLINIDEYKKKYEKAENADDFEESFHAFEISSYLYEGLILSEDLTSDKWKKLGENFPIKLKLWQDPKGADPVKLVEGFNLLEKIKQIYLETDKKYTNLKDKQKDIILKINNLTKQLGTVEANSIDITSKALAKEILKYANFKKKEKLTIMSKLRGLKENKLNKKYGSGLALLLFVSYTRIDKDNVIARLVRLTKLGLANSYKLGTNLPGKDLKTNSVSAYEKIINKIELYKNLPKSNVMIKKAKEMAPKDIESWARGTIFESNVPK